MFWREKGKRSMWNILHSIDTRGPGGAESIFISILSGIDKVKFRSIPIIPGEGWLFEQLNAKNFRPIVVSSKGSFNGRYLLEIIKVVRRYNIHLIQSHLLGSNVYCCLAGLLTGVPVLSTFHGFVDTQLDERMLKLKLAIVRKLSRNIVCVSNHLRKFLIRECGVAAHKTKVIYNGVDFAHFQPGNSDVLKKELGLKRSDYIVGSIGNIRSAKGYDILLRAAAEVKVRCSDVKFVIAGEGSEPLYSQLRLLRKELDLEDTVFFLGYRPDVVGLLHNFDVFLLTSTTEGFSIAVLEAMACGIPVIATKSGGPAEIIEDGVSGILVECGNFEAVQKAILRLVAKLEKGEVRTEVPQTYLELFDLKVMLKKYEKLYTEILSGG